MYQKLIGLFYILKEKLMLRFTPVANTNKNHALLIAYNLQQNLYAVPLDFSSLTAEKIKAYLDQINATTKATSDAVASATDLSFATVIQPQINLEIAQQAAVAMVRVSMFIHPDKAVREASSAAVEELEKFSIEQAQRQDVYAVFNKYLQTKYAAEASQLTLEETRYIEETNIEYKRSGLSSASAETCKQVTKIKQRLSELETKFQDNVNNVNTSFEYRKADLLGLPEDWFSEERLVRDDVYRVTLKYPDVFPILDYCKNRVVRAKISTELHSRCAAENLPLLLEALQLRQQLAAILGYANYANYASELRMVKSAANIGQFISDMNNRFEPLLKENLHDLTAFARTVEGDQQFALKLHDMRYYMKLREKQLCDVDHKSIAEYFNVDKITSGTLDIYQSILGLKFEQYSTNITWHKDVQFYRVRDAITNEMLGDFALDLYPRDGKYNHAAVFDLAHGCELVNFTGQHNTKQGHACVMVCNFPKNEGVSFDEVSTFFHEFGHMMHQICSSTQLCAYNGLSTETDFVEAPSQMLENWCYDPRVLQKLSAHKTTGMPIPQAMVQKIWDAERLHAGYFNRRQVMYATLDFTLHNFSGDQLKHLDLRQVEKQIFENILGLPHDDQLCIAAGFDHIIGGYAVGYYGYMYSNVIALDMFATKFAHNPLDPAAGKAYRKYILEPGSTKDGDQLVRDFLGREPKLDAFLAHCGLKQEAAAATSTAKAALKVSA